MVAFTASYTALTSRVIRDMGQAVFAEGLRTHAVRALSGSRCPSFFYYFFFVR